MMWRWMRLFLLIGAAATGCTDTTVSLLDGGAAADAPRVSITSPLEGLTVPQSALLAFRGVARDAGGRTVADADLEWRSDRDGLIGRAPAFDRSGLSSGRHAIALRRTDDADSRADTVALEVAPPATGPALRIAAPPGGLAVDPGAVLTLSATALTGGLPITDTRAYRWRTRLGPIDLGEGPDITATGLLSGVQRLTVTVRDPQSGDSATAAVDITVRAVPPAGLQGEIRAPASGTPFLVGEPIVFQGSARDGQGNPIAATDLVWRSSLTGFMATGETCIIDFLQPGWQRITMTATAPSGAVIVQAILIDVRNP